MKQGYIKHESGTIVYYSNDGNVYNFPKTSKVYGKVDEFCKESRFDELDLALELYKKADQYDLKMISNLEWSYKGITLHSFWSKIIEGVLAENRPLMLKGLCMILENLLSQPDRFYSATVNFLEGLDDLSFSHSDTRHKYLAIAPNGKFLLKNWATVEAKDEFKNSEFRLIKEDTNQFLPGTEIRISNILLSKHDPGASYLCNFLHNGYDIRLQEGYPDYHSLTMNFDDGYQWGLARLKYDTTDPYKVIFKPDEESFTNYNFFPEDYYQGNFLFVRL